MRFYENFTHNTHNTQHPPSNSPLPKVNEKAPYLFKNSDLNGLNVYHWGATGGFESSLEWAEEEERKRKEKEEGEGEGEGKGEGEGEGEGGMLDGKMVGGGNVLMMGGKGGGERVCEWVYERRGGQLGEVVEMEGGVLSFLHFCAVEGKVFFFFFFFFLFYFYLILFYFILFNFLLIIYFIHFVNF